MKINFISKNATKYLTTREKIQMILKLVRNNVMIVLEEGLSPEEQLELLKETMREIDPLKFVGVDIISFNGPNRLYSRESVTSLTIIAPGGRIEIVKRTPNQLSVQLL